MFKNSDMINIIFSISLFLAFQKIRFPLSIFLNFLKNVIL